MAHFNFVSEYIVQPIKMKTKIDDPLRRSVTKQNTAFLPSELQMILVEAMVTTSVILLNMPVTYFAGESMGDRVG